MSSAMGKIHGDLWPNYQIWSMNLLNQTLKESKLLAQRDVQRQERDMEKILDDRQKQVDNRQKQLDSMQQQMKPQQQQLQQQQLLFQQQQQLAITQMPPPPAPGPKAVASSTPVLQALDTRVGPLSFSRLNRRPVPLDSQQDPHLVVHHSSSQTLTQGELDSLILICLISMLHLPVFPVSSTPMTPMTLINRDDSQTS